MVIRNLHHRLLVVVVVLCLLKRCVEAALKLRIDLAAVASLARAQFLPRVCEKKRVQKSDSFTLPELAGAAAAFFCVSKSCCGCSAFGAKVLKLEQSVAGEI